MNKKYRFINDKTVTRNYKHVYVCKFCGKEQTLITQQPNAPEFECTCDPHKFHETALERIKEKLGQETFDKFMDIMKDYDYKYPTELNYQETQTLINQLPEAEFISNLLNQKERTEERDERLVKLEPFGVRRKASLHRRLETLKQYNIERRAIIELQRSLSQIPNGSTTAPIEMAIERISEEISQELQRRNTVRDHNLLDLGRTD